MRSLPELTLRARRASLRGLEPEGADESSLNPRSIPHQLVADQDVGIRADREIALERPVEGEDQGDDQPDEGGE